MRYLVHAALSPFIMGLGRVRLFELKSTSQALWSMPEVMLTFRAHVAYQAHVGFVNFGLSFRVERLLGRERHLRTALWCLDEHRGYDVPSVSPPRGA